MPETEGINFKVGALQKNQDSKRKINNSRGPKYDNPNLDDIFRFIDNQTISEDEKKKLIKIIKNMPHGALKTFRDNYYKYLKRIWTYSNILKGKLWKSYMQ